MADKYWSIPRLNVTRGPYDQRYVERPDGSFAPVVAALDPAMPTVVIDDTPNNSNKTFVVPAATWDLLSLHVILSTTATLGNRQLEVVITDPSDNVLHRIVAGSGQGPTSVVRYSFGVGAPDMLGFRDTDKLSVSLPALALGPGWKVQVLDNKAIDAAADDMSVALTVQARAV